MPLEGAVLEIAEIMSRDISRLGVAGRPGSLVGSMIQGFGLSMWIAPSIMILTDDLGVMGHQLVRFILGNDHR